MKIERKIVLTEQEKNMLVYLRDKFEYLLKDEDDFSGREDADVLYDALWNFCTEFLEDA